MYYRAIREPVIDGIGSFMTQSGREASEAFPSQQVLVSLGGLSPSPFVRLPRRFRHSRCWCLGLATPPPSPVGWSSGLVRPVWEGAWLGRAVSQSFLLGFEGDVRQSGREAFPSQQALVFAPGEASLEGCLLVLL